MADRPTLTAKLTDLHARQASRDHLLKDGMRLLDAAEVAFLLGFRDYRNAYRESIPRSRLGWLAKDVKRHMEGSRHSSPTRTRLAPNRDRSIRSTDAPLWGPDAA